MNISELAQLLCKEGFRPDVYSIDGQPPPYEGLILKQEASKWVIDYFERGSSRRLHAFEREDEACEKMYELMNKYFRW